jgi:hypothetical protein
MGFIDEVIETTESFLQTVGQIDKPFDIAWALLVGAQVNATAPSHHQAIYKQQ